MASPNLNRITISALGVTITLLTIASYIVRSRPMAVGHDNTRQKSVAVGYVTTDVGRAIELYRDGQYSDCVAVLEPIVKTHPSHTRHLFLAKSYLELGQHDKALTQIRAYFARDRNGGHVSTYLSGDLANILQFLDRSGQRELADQCLNKMLALPNQWGLMPERYIEIAKEYPAQSRQERMDRAYALAEFEKKWQPDEKGVPVRLYAVASQSCLSNVDWKHSTDPIVMWRAATSHELNLPIAVRTDLFDRLLVRVGSTSKYAEDVLASYHEVVTRPEFWNRDLIRRVETMQETLGLREPRSVTNNSVHISRMPEHFDEGKERINAVKKQFPHPN